MLQCNIINFICIFNRTIMNRKSFIRLLAAIPAFNIPFRSLAAMPTLEECKTHGDAEGPFYKANAPHRSIIETKGDALKISGRVFKSGDCRTPVGKAVLDIWHCNNEGNYDMNGFKGRGCVISDSNGRYTFTTILPPPYGSRPRHIHFKVRAEGFPELTTQLYFHGDPNIQNDFARNAERDRVIALKSEDHLKTGVFDIYI